MDIDSLKLFLHLAETLHYGTTSKSCNLSPSTLSRTIKRLESQLGQQLFERDNRTVRLTETGIRFREYAREALGRWQTLQDAIAADTGVLRGEISMYCTVTASYGVLPELLVRFRRAYPQVHIKLLTGGSERAIQNVIDGETDFAVAAIPDRIPARLLFQPLTDVQLRFVAPAVPWPGRDLLQRRPMPWERIPLILAEKGMARKRTDAWLRDQAVTPNVYARVSGNESILALVSMGFGVGVLPGLVLEKNLLRSAVQPLPVTPAIPPYSVGLCVHRRRTSSPTVQAFWEIART